MAFPVYVSSSSSSSSSSRHRNGILPINMNTDDITPKASGHSQSQAQTQSDNSRASDEAEVLSSKPKNSLPPSHVSAPAQPSVRHQGRRRHGAGHPHTKKSHPARQAGSTAKTSNGIAADADDDASEAPILPNLMSAVCRGHGPASRCRFWCLCDHGENWLLFASMFVGSTSTCERHNHDTYPGNTAGRLLGHQQHNSLLPPRAGHIGRCAEREGRNPDCPAVPR